MPALLYIDGLPVQTQPLPTNLGRLANAEPVVIGGTDEPSPSPDRSFAGALDELAGLHGAGSASVSVGDGSQAFYPDEAGALFGCSGGLGRHRRGTLIREAAKARDESRGCRRVRIADHAEGRADVVNTSVCQRMDTEHQRHDPVNSN